MPIHKEVVEEEERKLWETSASCPAGRDCGRAYLSGALAVLKGLPERGVNHKGIKEEKDRIRYWKERISEMTLWSKRSDAQLACERYTSKHDEPIPEVPLPRMDPDSDASFSATPPTPTSNTAPHPVTTNDNTIFRRMSRHVTGPGSRWEFQISSSVRGFGGPSSAVLRKDAVMEAAKMDFAVIENGGKIGQGHRRIGVPMGLQAACTSRSGQWS